MYKYLLWDMDNTLLDFNAAESLAIKALFRKYGFRECTDEMISRYSKINHGYWEALERGEVEKSKMLVDRFADFFDLIGEDTSKAFDFNADYQVELGEYVVFMPHASEVLQELRGKYKQIMVTNGTKVAQTKKLITSGLGEVFDSVYISEDIGYEKPSKEFFDYLFDKEGITDKSEVLIIGDSLTSDILGGNNAGIDTCWFNPKEKVNDKGVDVTYNIKCINEVLKILRRKLDMQEDLLKENMDVADDSLKAKAKKAEKKAKADAAKLEKKAKAKAEKLEKKAMAKKAKAEKAVKEKKEKVDKKAKQVKADVDRAKTVKRGKLNFFGTMMLVIGISVLTSTVLITLLTLPKAESLVKDRIYDYTKSQGQMLKYQLEEKGGAAGTSYDKLNSLFGSVKLNGMPGSYVYIVDKNGTMLYHPTKEKVGQPVENSVISGIVEDMKMGVVPVDEAVTYKYKGANKIAGYSITLDNEIIVITVDEKEALAACNSLTTRAVTCGIIVLIVLLGVGFYVAKIISDPLAQISEYTQKLADGYIADSLTVKSHIDETLSIADSANVLQKNLYNIVQEIRGASSNLTDSVTNTNILCNTSAEGAGQITSAVDELATAAQTMAEAVQDLNVEMMNMEANIESIDGAVEALNDSSDSMKAISEEAELDIRDVYNSSVKSVEAVEKIADHMSALAQGIKDVASATELINDISFQTNLLSLNASIEAARAGAAGRGFAVVAEQIGSLAAQSAESAKQIGDISKNIIELSRVSTELTDQVKVLIDDEQIKVNKTQDSFLKLKEQIDNSIVQISNISDETTKLTESKESAVASVSDLSAISEENAASNQEVTASITGLAGNINDISGRSNDMAAMADTLNVAIKAFKD